MNYSTEIKFSIKILFYFFILLLPFDNIISFLGVSIVTYVGFILMLSVLTNRALFLKSNSIFKLLLVVFSIGTLVDLGVFYDSKIGLNELIRYLMLFVLMLISYSLAIRGKLITIIWVVYASTIILLLYQLFSSIDLNNIDYFSYTNSETRMTTLGNDPNFVACYLSLGMIMSIYLLLKEIPAPKKMWNLSLLLIPSFMFGIINTGSRGILVALFFGILSIVLTKKDIKNQLLYTVFIAILIGFGSYLVLLDESFKIRLLSTYLDGDLAGRERIWQKAWELSSDSPFFGLGHYGYLSELGFTTSGSGSTATHNIFLSTLLATGWTGIIFFLIFNYYILKSVWKYRVYPFGNFLFTAFIVCLLSAQSINLEITKWYWVILALSASLKYNHSYLIDSKDALK